MYAEPKTQKERCDYDVEDFRNWIDFAKKHHMAVDYNVSYFTHPMMKDGCSLASPDDAVRAYWVRAGINGRRICEAILRDEHAILTVSSLLTGQFGLHQVCLSLPSIVGAEGIERTLPIELSDEEERAIRHSGDTLREALASIGY